MLQEPPAQAVVAGPRAAVKVVRVTDWAAVMVQRVPTDRPDQRVPMRLNPMMAP